MDYNYRNEQANNLEFIGTYGYVKCSTYRRKVLNTLFLDNSIQTPKEIANNCTIRMNHISKTLRELKHKGLIVCMNENVRKGRMYTLTKLGRDMVLFFVENDGAVWNE